MGGIDASRARTRYFAQAGRRRQDLRADRLRRADRRDAVSDYAANVADGSFPAEAESYRDTTK